MNNKITIDLDEKSLFFIIKGDINKILLTRRLQPAFRRLNFKEENGFLFVPYESATKIEILQEIQELLAKFYLYTDSTNEVKNSVNNFNREQENFEVFSCKAKMIKENQFKNNPELVSAFDNFQSIIKKCLKRELFRLQLLSAYHMAFSQNSCNFSVPGSGKTSIVYAAYAYLKNLPKNDPKHVDKLLVIGPISSFGPWTLEYEKCFGQKTDIQRLSGDINISKKEKKQHLYSGNPAEITLIYHGGVDKLQKEIIDFLKKNKTMVVIDEAHKIKNPEGVWGKSVINISKEAIARVVLTGTPAPNGYEDLYNLYQFIYPFQYKNILKFNYVNLVDMSKNNSLDNNRVKQFTNNISPYFIRIKKSDLKLPPIKEKTLLISMDKNQREIYDFIETKYIKSFKKNSSATLKDIFNKAKLIRLRQAATNPSLLIKSIKETLEGNDFEAMLSVNKNMPEEFMNDPEILSKICNYTNKVIPQKFIYILNLVKEIIKSGNKVLIWTIFIQNAKELQQYLQDNGFKSKLLIGEIELFNREKIVEKFNNPKNEDFQIIITNPFTVAESISLHMGCHNAIYMERDYNCSNFIQSKDRIHRVGLPKNQETNYYYFLSKDSIDEVINNRLDMKVKRMEKIIDEDIPLFTSLNDSDETDLIKALLEDYARRS